MKKFGELSFNDIRTMIEKALNPAGDFMNWVQDVYPEKCIVSMSGELYEVPYTIKDGNAEMGEKQRVKVSYEAFAELKGVEILQTGTHVSAEGSKVTYTESDLDELIKNGEELKDVVKPPLVVGHAEGDLSELINAQTVGAPQVGFVIPFNLTKKKNNDGSFTLFGDIKDIAAKAVDKIGTELKRVSPEIYNNFKFGDKSYGKVLRRVSFVPIPSIKTMADVTQAHLAFGEKPDQPTTWVIFSEEIPKSKREEKPKMEVTKMQEQIDGLTTKLSEATTKLAEATALITTLTAEKKDAVSKLSETQRLQKRAEIHQFCENLKRDGKLIPAMQKMGIERFMEALDDSTVRKFAEGDSKCPECGATMEEKDGQMVCPKCGKTVKMAEAVSPLAFMKKFMESFGKIVRFGEVGKTGDDPNKGADGKTAAEKLSECTKKIMDGDKTMKFAEAFEQAQKDNPELAQEYLAEMTAKK